LGKDTLTKVLQACGKPALQIPSRSSIVLQEDFLSSLFPARQQGQSMVKGDCALPRDSRAND
jgi:hypothetical protein